MSDATAIHSALSAFLAEGPYIDDNPLPPVSVVDEQLHALNSILHS